MSEQTDIAVRRLIEMTKAGEIEWIRFEGADFIADVEIGDNAYALKVKDRTVDYYVEVNGSVFAHGKKATPNSPEYDLHTLIERTYCKHAEFLRDMGATP